MAENFHADAIADIMRAQAQVEMHDNTLRGPLLDTYASLSSTQLKSVATELEATNAGLSSAPRAEISRENGEVKSVSFIPGNIDFAPNAHKLTLTSKGDLFDFVKNGQGRISMSGIERNDHSGREAQALSNRLNDEHKTLHDGVITAVSRSAATDVGALLGRYASIGAGASRGSRLNGFAIGSGIEVAELAVSNSLKTNHPALSAFLRPTIAEAVMVGAAAAVGTASMRVRVGLVAGAWLVGKADRASEYMQQRWTSK